MAAGKRKENESFKDYRARLVDQQKGANINKAGELLWHPSRGTYTKAKHGQIGSR